MMKAVMISVALILTPAIATAQPAPPSLKGDWDGKLQIGDQTLRIILHVAETVTLDSPDQNAYGLPGSIALDGAIARAKFPDIGATIEGPLSADGQTLNAELSQAGLQIPLPLTRRNAP